MNAYDCYAAGKKIARQLSETGHKEWSDRIRDAIAYGCTSGEILSNLGWQLDELRKSGLVMSELLKSEVSVLISQIDEICKG